MNFIDKALAEFTNGEDFVQKMADIYEYPEVREELANYPTWIRNIITVIDYDTELAMDGLEFKSYRNVIDALTDMSQLQTVKTMIHEIAHAMLHADNDKVERKDAGTREVEAESIAYVVCQYLGLDTSDYSFAYLIGWSSGRQMPELRASLHTIQTTAADLIDRIEEQIRKAEPEDSGQETSDVAGDYFEIYQLKENMENRQFYFMDLSFWQSRGLPVEHTRYDVTYTASLDEKTTLDDIYCRFNIDRPSDFFGHSLSVSDVVVLHRKGKTDSYFVDNIGFQPVTDFFKKEPKDVAV